jgi:hypothetical protein
MNAPAPLTPPVYSALMPCPECEGTGYEIGLARVIGEAFDADWIELPCEACGAEGEVDAVCEGCSRMVPCCDGLCMECSDYGVIPFIPVERLSPTQVMLGGEPA